MIQAITKDRGGTVESYFVGGRPASCTVSLYSGDGGLKIDEATCDVDSVNTTLAASAAEGDTTLSLASVVGIANDRRYLVGGEEVGVRSVAGGVATLWSPLVFDHASGDSLLGLRVSYDVLAADAGVLWWDGYAVFTPAIGDQQTETIDCVRRKIPDRLIDLSDIRMIIPKDQKALSEELDLHRALRLARDNFLMRLGGKNRAQTILGVDHFRHPCAIQFWLDRRTEFGDEWAQQMSVLEKELDRLVAEIISQGPVDADQDGATNGPDDGGFTVIQLDRA